MSARSAELITLLNLQPHPEGGWFREIHRARTTVAPTDGRPLRSALTVIDFRLERGQSSAWHLVDSDECWQYCEGDPLELLTLDPRTGQRDQIELGPITHSRRATSIVPAKVWQAARPLGDYTLVQCAVGPGFDFADFQMLRDLQGQDEIQRTLGPWSELL